jgi:hypothetical protein
MAAVTERLLFTLAARAPVVTLTRNDFNSIRCFLSDFWLHDKFLLNDKLQYLFMHSLTITQTPYLGAAIFKSESMPTQTNVID